MCEPLFLIFESELYLDEIKTKAFIEGIVELNDAEQGGDNIEGSITHFVELTDALVSFNNVAVGTFLEDVLDQLGMRLIAYFVDVHVTNEFETIEGGLQVVDGLTHIAICGENDSLEAFLVERHLISL